MAALTRVLLGAVAAALLASPGAALGSARQSRLAVGRESIAEALRFQEAHLTASSTAPPSPPRPNIPDQFTANITQDISGFNPGNGSLAYDAESRNFAMFFEEVEVVSGYNYSFVGELCVCV